jgi:hypothetical protein
MKTVMLLKKMSQIIMIATLTIALLHPATTITASSIIVLTMIVAHIYPAMGGSELLYASVNATALSSTSPVVHLFVLNTILASRYKSQLANAYISSLYLHFLGFAIINSVNEFVAIKHIFG